MVVIGSIEDGSTRLNDLELVVSNYDADADTTDLNATGAINIDPQTARIILELENEITAKSEVINRLKYEKLSKSRKYKHVQAELDDLIRKMVVLQETIYTKNAEMTSLLDTSNVLMIKLAELRSKLSTNMMSVTRKRMNGGKRQRKTGRRNTQRRRM
jgi:hypothetical protein